MRHFIATTLIVSLIQVSFTGGQIVSGGGSSVSTSSSSSSSSSSTTSSSSSTTKSSTTVVGGGGGIITGGGINGGIIGGGIGGGGIVGGGGSIGGGPVIVGGGGSVGGGSTVVVGGGGSVRSGSTVVVGGGGSVGGGLNGGVIGGGNTVVVGGGGSVGGVIGGGGGNVVVGGASGVSSVSSSTVIASNVGGGSINGGIIGGGINEGIIGGGINGGIIGGGINGGVVSGGVRGSVAASSASVSASSASIVQAPAPIIIPAVVSANDIAAPELIPIPVPTPGTASTNVISIISQANTQVTQQQIIQLRVVQTSIMNDIEGAIEALEAAKLQASQQANTWYFPTPELRRSFFDTFVTVEDLINQARTYINGANRLLIALETNNIYLQLAWVDRVQKLQGQAALALVRAAEARALILSQISQVTTDMNLYREGRDEQLAATKIQIDQAVRTVAEETQLLGVRIRDILSRAILEWSVLLRNSLGAGAQIQIDQMNSIANAVLGRLGSLRPGELDSVLIQARTCMEQIRTILYSANLSASQISGSITPVTSNMYNLFGGSSASAAASASASSGGLGGATASAAASAAASSSLGGLGGGSSASAAAAASASSGGVGGPITIG